MVSSSLALLYFLLGFHGGRQGRGPDRGQSPVEWGDFLSVRTSIHPFAPPLGHPATPEAQRGDKRMDGRTENLPILQDFVPIGAAAHKPEERCGMLTKRNIDLP